MDTETFLHLQRIVSQNPDLQCDLQRFEDRDAFIARVLEIGAHHNLDFTAEYLTEKMRENRRVWIERWI